MRRSRSCRLRKVRGGVFLIFAIFFRQHFDKNQRVGNRDRNQNQAVYYMHFFRQPFSIGKGTERVDGRVGEDAGEQAATPIKQNDKQEADCDRKNDLTQIFRQGHAAAV